MKILTMNLWHGLSPSNLLWFEALEPVPRKELREKIQLELIKQIDPDIAYFQEMNPITTKFKHFCTELGRHGGFQPDLVGLKVLGVGLPVNLFSGLAVLAKPSWPLKVVSALRLSGHNSFVSRWASFQLKEERYALFCETVRPNVGKILFVNSHLHHGLEATEEFVERFSAAMDDLKLSPTLRSEIRDRLMAGNERRSKEMSTLLKELERLSPGYEMVVLGGDFNCEPSGEIGQRLREHGFTDVWAKAHPTDPGYTYDRERNPGNHILQDRFPSTFMIEDCSFDAKTKSVLTKLTVDQERRQRRIDQLWIRGAAPVNSVQSELVGFPNAEGMAPSDHFGLVTNLGVD